MRLSALVLAKDPREYGAALWTFARVEGIEPTNIAPSHSIPTIHDEFSTTHGARFYGLGVVPARARASADAGPMPRSQHTYDHRLVRLVQDTDDITIATGVGVPRSTAAGWLRTASRRSRSIRSATW